MTNHCRFEYDFELAGLDFGQVEKFIDKSDEVTRTRGKPRDICGLRFVQGAGDIRGKKVGIAEDRPRPSAADGKASTS